ncbi:MAG: isoamylase early set domain-containing protein [Gemmatimonadales bacterium]
MKQEHELLRRYLDGELPREALPVELRAEAARFERLFAALDPEDVRLRTTLRADVMRQIRQERRTAWRAFQWLVAPRPIRVSPLAAALSAAAVLALVLFTRAAPDRMPGLPGADRVDTRFIYLAPQASRVAVTGDFVNWDPDGVPLERRSDGVWVAELRLEPGLHHYVFVIDGTEWRPDPNAASHVDDGFGRRNSVLLIAPPVRHAS